MEIWILIFSLLAIAFFGCTAAEMYENYQFNKVMRNRYMKELARAARANKKKKTLNSFEEIRKRRELETTSSTGEEQISLLVCNEEEEDAAEKLIKQAKEKKINCER